MAENNNGVGTVFLSFVLGAAIGGGLALLTAPRSGPETRKKLREMVDETRDELQEMSDNAEARVKKVAQDGRDLLEEKAEIIKAAVEAGKKAAKEELAKQQKT